MATITDHPTGPDATVIPLPVRRPRAHPALGPCTDCGSEDVRPLHDDSAGGTVVGVRCISCGWLVSLQELARLRAAVEGVAIRAGARS